MSLLMELLPVISWESGPIIASLVGGKSIHQLLGSTYGELSIGIILYLIFRPHITINEFIWYFIGGALWSGAQLNQFQSFKWINVSTAMPISTGLQLVGTPLMGVISWDEWNSISTKVIGSTAIAVLIIGIVMNSYNDTNNTTLNSENRKKAFLILLIGSLGYIACNVFPKIPNASGIASVVPQTFGMFIGSIVVGFIIKIKSNNKEKIFTNKYVFKNYINGILGGLGIYGYLTSMNMNGVATAFPITQLNVQYHQSVVY